MTTKQPTNPDRELVVAAVLERRRIRSQIEALQKQSRELSVRSLAAKFSWGTATRRFTSGRAG